MRKRIVAGNWKMNLDYEGAIELIKSLKKSELNDTTRVVVFPSSLFLKPVIDLAEVEVGVQNFCANDNGAYTGELSIEQLKSIGCNIGLVGHSERRMIFGESNEVVKRKVNAAIQKNFSIIFCCGEPLDVRENGSEFEFVKNQLDESLFHLNQDEIKKVIIAYEPVWAIGTGKTASAEQAEAMHSEIRKWIKEKYSTETGDQFIILYGGSCNASNAIELFHKSNVDGGLIGGAALKSESFIQIVNA